jgi:hypothetical protein
MEASCRESGTRTIETLTLPVATVALAVATVWLALEQRRGRSDAAHNSMSAAFEACPRDCDESLHCRQCAKSLTGQLAGRRA